MMPVRMLFGLKFGELRKYALPATGSPYKNIRRSFLSSELLPGKFRFRPGQRGDDRGIAVRANLHIIGFHQIVA